MPAAAVQRTYPHEISLGGQTVHLRLMTVGDSDRILEFARSLDEESLLFLRMDITQPEVVEKWVASVESGQRVTVIAEVGGKLVGYGSLNRKELSWTRHQGEIRIIVNQSFRHTGLGSQLATEMFDIARDLGLTKIVAQMPASRPCGRKLFETLGFKPEALLTDWVIDRQGRTHDLLVMSHDVNEIMA